MAKKKVWVDGKLAGGESISLWNSCKRVAEAKELIIKYDTGKVVIGNGCCGPGQAAVGAPA